MREVSHIPILCPCLIVSISFCRRDSALRPSWTSVLNTTKERARAWSPKAQEEQVSLGGWPMDWDEDHRWRTSLEGRRPQPHSACCRDREKVMRRTWRRSVVVQRALIRRWGHLLLPAQLQHCTMETDRSEGMLDFQQRRLLHATVEPACANDVHLNICSYKAYLLTLIIELAIKAQFM